MTPDSHPSANDFDEWFLRRTAEAVEACEVSEALLRRVQTELRRQAETAPFDNRESAVRHLEELGGMSEEDAKAAHEMMREFPDGIRERFVRWLAERWLESHRRMYQKKPKGG